MSAHGAGVASTPPPLLRSTEASPLVSYASATGSSPNRSEQEERKRVRAKRLTLLAACIIPFGAHYIKQSLPPLRPFFETAGTSSYYFGLMLSAAAWPNLFQPFLAGLFIDSKGHEHGSIVFTAVTLFGHSIFAASLTRSGIEEASVRQAVIGRMMFGLGSGGSGVVQGAIVAHHFDDDITFAVGVTQSMHYLAKWLGRATPVPIANYFDGSFAASVWMGSAFALISCLTAVAYVVWEDSRKPFTFALNGKGSNGKLKRHVSLDTDASGSDIVADDESYFQMGWNIVYSLPWAFWALGLLHLLFGSISTLFAGFSTSYLVETFDLTPEVAAYYASLDTFLPIFVSPVIGRYVDNHGGRLGVCAISGVVCAMSFLLLLHQGAELPMGPLIPMLLISFSSCTTPTLIKSGVTLVAPRDSLGTAFSLYLVFEAIGGSIGHVGLGYLKDLTNSYEVDLYVLFCICLLASGVTLVVRHFDKTTLNCLLNAKKNHGLIL